MSDLQIARDVNGEWDLVLVDGDAVLVHTVSVAAEVAQRVVYRVSTWYGESPYDRGVGLPYLDGIFGFEPVPGVAALISQTILDTEGVLEIVDNPDYILASDRELSLAFAIRVDGTTVDLALEITP